MASITRRLWARNVADAVVEVEFEACAGRNHVPAGISSSSMGGHLTDVVLDLVRERVGVDFSQYRASTIERRIRNRMLSVGASSLEDYLIRLEATDGEAEALADRLAIKVSRFYRNRPTFDLVRALLPRVAATTPAPLRVWCAGCARGEEAYTLAMMLDEAGIDGVVEATDIDRGALASAALGVYTSAATEELPSELARRYLQRAGTAAEAPWRVVPPLRNRVRFAWHDVTTGPPPEGVGTYTLVSCRNVLIYLQPAPQVRALQHLATALAPGGALVLGEAEWVPAPIEPLFDVVDRASRLFMRVSADARGAA